MNLITRAFLFLRAKKGRTSLLTLVTTAILVFVLAGLTIKNAADTAVENAKKETGASVSVSVSRDYMMSQMTPPDSQNTSQSQESQTTNTSSSMPSLSLSQAQQIAENSEVKSYLFTSTTNANAGDHISPISTSSTTSSQTNQGENAPFARMASFDFTITGVNATDNLSSFSSSSNRISSGQGITEESADNSALISSDLADKNNLKVGDDFTVKTTINGVETSHTLTVMGIYTSSETTSSAQLQTNSSNPVNNIYTTITTANNLKGNSDSLDLATYTLKNPTKVNSFVKTVQKDLDSDKYSVTSSDELYQQMLSPLNTISSIAQYIVILVAVAGAIILTLIIMLSIRERRYEIGVLMSLGEHRLKIIGQFFIELVSVAVVSIMLAGACGNLIGNALGQQLLSSTTATHMSANGPQGDKAPEIKDTTSSDNTSKATDNKRPDNAPQGGGPMTAIHNIISPSSDINNLNIKVTASDLSKLGGIAILIAFISTCLASIGIIRMKPKDILTSH
ncbi:ABC transporter permease [Streptococcus sp. zg-JUN1979]|uniref:ABC transporter permease n=1 Tax=Streptococcus sp. zg-JUN1979 TaxID=3391450 RepID=UPI0039A6A848